MKKFLLSLTILALSFVTIGNAHAYPQQGIHDYHKIHHQKVHHKPHVKTHRQMPVFHKKNINNNRHDMHKPHHDMHKPQYPNHKYNQPPQRPQKFDNNMYKQPQYGHQQPPMHRDGKYDKKEAPKYIDKDRYSKYPQKFDKDYPKEVEKYEETTPTETKVNKFKKILNIINQEVNAEDEVIE